MTPNKPRLNPDVNKTTLYAIIVNAIQIVALAAFVLLVTLTDLGSNSRFSLQLIAVVGAVMAGWGAMIDIQDALRTRRRERTINELQTTNEQMDALNLKLRAQRHDFLNHVQVVYSLLEMQEYAEATGYLERVYDQLRSVSKVMRTRMTAFNALLQVKSAACEERGVTFLMDIRSALENMPIPSWELCCIIGNLLDNAMDAVLTAGDPQSELTATEDLRGYVLTVRNNGKPVPPDMEETIFEAGVSTKGEGRGMGLSIVRQTLAEYGGTIFLATGEQDTAFTVTVPKGSAEGAKSPQTT